MAWHLLNSMLSLCSNLLPSIGASAHAPPSSSSNINLAKGHAAEEELKRLMRTLERIKATLYDAEEREIRDRSVKLWLKELRMVAYDAQNVLAEYRYEVTRVQLEARKASDAPGSSKRKQMEYAVPISDGMLDHLNKIRSKFDEIAKDREALQLKETDGVRCQNNKFLRNPTGHMVDEASIFGRDADIKKVIDLLLTIKENPFAVISIIGKGGIGKTTIARLVYKDARVCQYFDLFSWVCVSEDFNIKRIIRATIESVNVNCVLSELSSLQEKLATTVMKKRLLLVLDDVWNENQNLWELFQVAFTNAAQVSVLVTTRNEKVAEVMQTIAYFRPNYLHEDSCWQLFQHYAFGGTNHTVSTRFAALGRVITRKCGGLPLAVKSIASLLRHETDEESWRDILESDLWESNPMNDIFPALQISYYHLPAHLKPCFLLISMYPKDYLLCKINLILLWISHGYVESRVKRKLIEVGAEYYEELKERSFLDVSDELSECCKLHDIVHDLGRLNSEREHHSVEIYKPPDFQQGMIPQETYHLYVRGSVGYFNQIFRQNFTSLRTLSTNLRGCKGDFEHQYCIKAILETMDLNRPILEQLEDYGCCRGIFNITKFESLTVLELSGHLTEIPKSISKLKLLSYLKITSSHLCVLTSSLGLLYNLHTIILDCWLSPLEYLPESIGNLTNLWYMHIKFANIKRLPKSLWLLSNLHILVISSLILEEIPSDLGKLHNLRELTIDSWLRGALPQTIGCLDSLEEFNIPRKGELQELPVGLGNCRKLKTLKVGCCLLNCNPQVLKNFVVMRSMVACLNVRTIAWLKHMNTLEGVLVIEGLKNTSNLVDAQNANLKSKCRIKTLDLCWHNDRDHYHNDNSGRFVSKKLTIRLIEEHDQGRQLVGSNINFHLLECLQPQPQLKILILDGYPSDTVPDWMRQPFSLQAIQEIKLVNCDNLKCLPFNNLGTLKRLQILNCSSIRFLQLEQLPSQLEDLTVFHCHQLEMISGLWHMERLAELTIFSCIALESIRTDELQLGETIQPMGACSYEKPRDSQKSTSWPTTLHIFYCPSLLAFPDHLIRCSCLNDCKKRELYEFT